MFSSFQQMMMWGHNNFLCTALDQILDITNMNIIQHQRAEGGGSQVKPALQTLKFIHQ